MSRYEPPVIQMKHEVRNVHVHGNFNRQNIKIVADLQANEEMRQAFDMNRTSSGPDH